MHQISTLDTTVKKVKKKSTYPGTYVTIRNKGMFTFEKGRIDSKKEGRLILKNLDGTKWGQESMWKGK
jgi:hypothetical protein